ncbi:hypothetical protein ACA910_014484 [Epithemia clementina (nom. ined.)]
MASSEQVIELSIEETNKLRAQLGLSPLRGVGPQGAKSSSTDYRHGNVTSLTSGAAPLLGRGSQETVLELSVSETNALRARLGLAPLREGIYASAAKHDQHAPAPNQGDLRAAAERIEQSKLRKQVEEGIQQRFKESSLGADSNNDDGAAGGSSSLVSWAQQMRYKSQHAETQPHELISNKLIGTRKEYSDADLKGLSVAHSMQDIQGTGSSVVLTLADTEILEINDASRKVVGLSEAESALENVNLAEEQKQKDGLRKKRQIELGMGRAGGYAGFDDDEFMELGGAQAPSRTARVEGQKGDMDDDYPTNSKQKRKHRKVGFQIGAMLDEQDKLAESDLFAAESGKAISLESSSTEPQHPTTSDFMTAEEYEELNSKKKKKSSKFKKKKKDKKDKDKSKHDRRRSPDEEDENEDDTVVAQPNKSSSILADLEATRKAQGTLVLTRKRRLTDEGDPDGSKNMGLMGEEDGEHIKAQRYASIMEKGNERTRKAFDAEMKQSKASTQGMDDDEEPDDAFLSAALAKARRLNRLRELAEKKQQPLGEDAVLEAVRSASVLSGFDGQKEEGKDSEGKLVFEVDETREFTRALRARQEQAERSSTRAKTPTIVKGGQTIEVDKKTEPQIKQEEEEEDAPDMDVQMSELAKQIKDDDEDDDAAAGGGLEGTTESSIAIGRGLVGVLSILKQTGEITKKNAGREEQRGRAKDERTYEDYEPLDLSKVVQLDERTATEKDKELAKREIKLEYRDKYGRLLTRKEAFRDLSYHFHGYSSGKRKQEKKLQQIAREQAEQRLASRQASSEGGTLGALKATQKATGKAFIVHKTS